MRPAGDDIGFEPLLAELARESLTAQHDVLRDLRTGAGMLLAATSLIASFLGSEVLQRSGISPLTAMALGMFVVGLLATMYVLVSRPEVRSDLPTSRLLAVVDSTSRNPYEVVVELCTTARRANAPVIRVVGGAYNVSLGSVCLQTGLWVVQLLATM
jgi:hypothetical protein